MNRRATLLLRVLVVLVVLAYACTPKKTTTTEHVNRDALAKLTARSEKEHSSALIVVQDVKERGLRTLVETHDDASPPDEALVTMSVSKTIVALAILHAIEKGTIASLDVPMSSFIPSWSAPDPRSKITLRHVMTHTSGLTTDRAETWNGVTLRVQADKTQLTSPDAIGKTFVYNDNAVDFLSLAVHRASGFFLDDYLTKYIFGPLDVSGAYWMKDAEGHPRAAGELFMRASDLAKVGEFILRRGMRDDKKILDPQSIALLSVPSPREPTYGLLVWLHDGALVAKGYLGQWLVVDEHARIVAVRMRTPKKEEFADSVERDTYENFWRDVIALSR